MIRELAKKLTALTGFADWVITELTLRRGEFDSGAQVVKVHTAMALLRVSTAEEELSVKLIRPRREIRAALGTRIQTTNKIWRVFTASEVLEFVTSVSDNNCIHRLNPPIVPGLLILETICVEFAADFIKLKFKNFITAGEPLTLRVVNNRFEISSAGVLKVVGLVASPG